MRKRIICILALTFLCIMGVLLIPSINGNPHIEIVDGNMELQIPLGEKEIKILPWYDEKNEIYYFFVPSCVKSSQVLTGMWNEPVLNWEKNETYHIDAYHEGKKETYAISFMRASAISSMFINTESGSMEAIHADKMYEEAGDIMIMTSGGSMEYAGALERISGRGNSSWEYSKKPYAIKLKESQDLCGLQKGKKWNLLPIWREGNKMNTKVMFDIAAAAGLLYTPESTWVDLYLNNEYAGIYLLCESISVSGGRVEIFDLENENKVLNPDMEWATHFDDATEKGYELPVNPENISGGYLIEKDLEAYYKEEKVGFITDRGTEFTITAPQHASREQVSYIRNYIQNIEILLQEKSENINDYINIESFSAKYLVDEISLNFDTNITSMYFYKDKNNDFLYAGPVWDYDSALGECNAGYAEGWYVNYHNSILDKGSEFDWYSLLYENEQFKEEVRRQYKKLMPYLKEVIDKTIDLYAESIKDSVAMDSIRWKNEEADKPGNYVSFDSNVRYLKYFLCERLNWLSGRLGVSGYVFKWSGESDLHEVTFSIDGNFVEKILVQDGMTLSEVPILDEDIYWGWYFEYNDEKYRRQLPILEDMCVYAKKRN